MCTAKTLPVLQRFGSENKNMQVDLEHRALLSVVMLSLSVLFCFMDVAFVVMCYC